MRVTGRQSSEKIESQSTRMSFRKEAGTGEWEGQKSTRNADRGAVALQLPE